MENVRYMISDAANIVNVESHVLRYWEEELELAIPRNEMGHRYYTEENIAQFQKIKEWKEQGYQLKAIRMMIHSGQPAAGTGEFYGGQPAGELQTGGNNVIQMNRDYVETGPKPMVEKQCHPNSKTV